MRVEVSLVPSLPAKGESFTLITTDNTGGSIGSAGSACTTDGAQTVSVTKRLNETKSNQF